MEQALHLIVDELHAEFDERLGLGRNAPLVALRVTNQRKSEAEHAPGTAM